MSTKESRILFFDAIDELVGVSGHLYDLGDSGELPVSVVAYADVPEVGITTSFSFGLSEANHPEWVAGKPELVLSVASRDEAWPICLGEIVRLNRGRVLFTYGSILHFHHSIEEGCPLTSFLLFAPELLESSMFVLEDRVVNVAQLYPIHESEVSIIREIGALRFFRDSEICFEDIHRPAFAKLGACAEIREFVDTGDDRRKPRGEPVQRSFRPEFPYRNRVDPNARRRATPSARSAAAA